METSKKPFSFPRHSALDAESPAYKGINKGIAGHTSTTLSIQFRNDERDRKCFF